VHQWVDNVPEGKQSNWVVSTYPSWLDWSATDLWSEL
jgi:hypothetical protein